MSFLAAVMLVHALVFLTLIGVLVRRHRRRAGRGVSESPATGGQLTGMLWTEARVCNPVVGGTVLSDARAQDLPRGRRRR